MSANLSRYVFCRGGRRRRGAEGILRGEGLPGPSVPRETVRVPSGAAATSEPREMGGERVDIRTPRRHT